MGQQPLLHGNYPVVQKFINGIAQINGSSGIAQGKYGVAGAQWQFYLNEVNFFQVIRMAKKQNFQLCAIAAMPATVEACAPALNAGQAARKAQ